MKLVKMSVLALAMGLFVASCGNSNGDAAKTDTAAATPATTAPAPPAAAPATDTMNAGAAKPDTMAKAAPADTKMDKKDDKKMDAKKK